VPRTADRLRIALSSCQHWEQARFGAYRDMVAAQPDLILQVGDYIYEQSYAGQAKVRDFGAPEPKDLAGYRQRHALYKTDPELQAAHRAAPWIVTWDDHEVLNDYANLANREALPPDMFAPRRAAAYQAYFEHMPIRPSLWLGRSAPRLYRADGLGRSCIPFGAGHAPISQRAALRAPLYGAQCGVTGLRGNACSGPDDHGRSAGEMAGGSTGQ
jgi:alkaline phosphatase D